MYIGRWRDFLYLCTAADAASYVPSYSEFNCRSLLLKWMYKTLSSSSYDFGTKSNSDSNTTNNNCNDRNQLFSNETYNSNRCSINSSCSKQQIVVTDSSYLYLYYHSTIHNTNNNNSCNNNKSCSNRYY
jgi:hypothetical protein